MATAATSVRVVRTVEELLPWYAEWARLSSTAVETNPFYEPWMLIPALRYLGPRPGVEVVLVLDDPGEHLIGLFPLIQDRSYRHLPIPCYSTWRYRHSASATPLIQRGREEDCLRAFFAWFDQSARRNSWLRFRLFAGNGSLYEMARSVAGREGRVLDELEWNERALLESRMSGEEYLAGSLSAKHRKEYRRLWKRLSELGKLCYRQFDPGHDDLESWLAEFFAMESAGWKGRGGTAISNHENEKLFFLQMAQEALQQQRLSMSRIDLDNNLVAAECSFISNGCGFMLKIVYDEAYAKYSPGVLLVMKKTVEILDETGLERFDSCAIPRHPMIDRLWRERRQVCDFAVSGRSLPARAALAFIRQLVYIKQKLGLVVPG